MFFEEEETVAAPVVSTPAKSQYADLPPLRRFQLERQEQIAEKDRRAEQERRVRVEKAQEAIKTFNEERGARKTQQSKLNREQESDFLQSQQELEQLGNVWERVVRLIDLEQKPNRKDVSRLRQVLIQCKNTPPA